jgi:hypothetical protein
MKTASNKKGKTMCRNIHTLYNFEPPANETEIHEAALQYVRKISGFRQPSKVNEAAFNLAVENIARATAGLLAVLETSAPPRDRQLEAARAHTQALLRFGKGDVPSPTKETKR